MAIALGGNQKMSKFKEVLAVNQSAKALIPEVIKNTLDEESYLDFLEALKDKSISSQLIAKSIKVMGINISDNTVRRMRNNEQI